MVLLNSHVIPGAKQFDSSLAAEGSAWAHSLPAVLGAF